MESLAANIRYACRIFFRRKVFSAVVIITLAIGIGTSTAIFSFVNSILLGPLPFNEPDQLVIIESLKGGEKGRVSQREIADILENTLAFEDAAGYMPEAQYNLTERGEPEEIPANICQQNLFSVLGVKFIKGSAWPSEFDMRRSFGIVLSYLSGILYGVSQWDVQVYFAVALVSCMVALSASLFPAWRAARINPVNALKNE